MSRYQYPNLNNNPVLEFKFNNWTGKTYIFDVYDKFARKHIGTIKWFYPWRKYVYMPMEGTKISAYMTNVLNMFLNGLMREHKNHRIQKSLEVK